MAVEEHPTRKPHTAAQPGTAEPAAQRAASLGEELLSELLAAMPKSTLTHLRHQPARHSTTVPWPHWVHPDLVAYFKDNGIPALWAHQEATATQAFTGEDVIVATGTASGKSLGYQLPILSHIATATAPITALYLSPTKALAQNQRAALTRICSGTPALHNTLVATYDADTPPEARRYIRDEAQIIITNPDMVHASILGSPHAWFRLLRTLRYIVIDECHTYRGVFGAHVSLILRRLLRLTNGHPTIVLASATSTDPAAHARRLTGRRHFHAVTEDASPSGQRSIALWQPGLLDTTGEHSAPMRRAATSEAAEIMGRIIAHGARTLTFVRTRRSAETVALGATQQLSSMGRNADAQRVAAYRAGYTPEARRTLEKQLDNGELLGVASSNALELGIDIGGLDAVISSGFPGTIASFHQQAGRAGRRGQSALVMLVGADNPMDNYLLHHPEALLDKPVENTVFDPTNPYVLEDHVICAAAEKPMTRTEVENWAMNWAVDAANQTDARNPNTAGSNTADSNAAGSNTANPNAANPVGAVLDQLLQRGDLKRRISKGEERLVASLARAEEIHARMNIRGGVGRTVAIVIHNDGQLLGTVDAARAHSEVHTGAVYIHQGETYLVDELDLRAGIAWVHVASPPYTTRVLRDTHIRVRRSRSTRRVRDGVWLADVDVAVDHQVRAFSKRLPDGKVLETVPLDYPPETLQTRAVAYTVDPVLLQGLGLPEPTWPGSLHAAEHAAIALLPLVATCDRWDIGGVSTVLHEDTGLPTVFVYDGYAGGAGFSERGFHRFGHWMSITAHTVSRCECTTGCPSCIQSPKCGNANDPLFKPGAATILQALADAH